MTTTAGASGAYLRRYLVSSDAKIGSAIPRPIVPPKNLEKSKR